ncbi:MAG: hypothetical protein IJN85_00145, partial [Oscillospiraceae bacterium]|nr:hypothetical protein [Oscillospiraceae bacterium]
MNNKKIIAALCAVSMLAANSSVIISAEEALDNNQSAVTEVTENEATTEDTETEMPELPEDAEDAEVPEMPEMPELP